jgi:hypothetical protein
MVLKTGVFTAPYMSGVASAGVAKVYQHNTGVNADGSAVTFNVQTKALDCGDANAIKAVDYITVQTRRLTGTCRCRVGWANRLTDAITWSNYATLTAADEPLFFRSENIAGRFLFADFGSASLNADLAMTGFQIYGDVVGTWV